LLALLCLPVFPAAAGTLSMQVMDQRGQAVADAVLTLLPDGATASDPDASASSSAASPATHTIDQRDERFVPYVELFRPGDRVVFRNSDNTRHHAYSFAPEAAFEMVLKPGESSDPITLPDAGTIAVGCNIHDQMITYLVVADALRQGKTDSRGQWQADDLPPGHYRLGIWHPQIRPAGKAQTRELDIGSDPQSLQVRIDLGPDPRGSGDRERLDY